MYTGCLTLGVCGNVSDLYIAPRQFSLLHCVRWRSCVHCCLLRWYSNKCDTQQWPCPHLHALSAVSAHTFMPQHSICTHGIAVGQSPIGVSWSTWFALHKFAKIKTLPKFPLYGMYTLDIGHSKWMSVIVYCICVMNSVTNVRVYLYIVPCRYKSSSILVCSLLCASAARSLQTWMDGMIGACSRGWDAWEETQTHDKLN